MRIPTLPTVVILAFLQCSTARAQQGALPSLYATEYLWNKDPERTKLQLVCIRLDKEGRLTKPIVAPVVGGVFGVFGQAMLVQDRFVVTTLGGVIDVKTGKIIHDQRHGKSLGIEQDKVVYLVANVDRPNGIFAFDLKTHSCELLKEPGHWKLVGVKAPNKRMSINQERSGGPILLHHADGIVTRLGEGLRVTYKPFASPHLGGLPFLWIDEERVLTQAANGALIILDIKGKQTDLVTIEEELGGALSPPHLYRDLTDRIVYRANASWVIDIKKKSATKLTTGALGHGFESATQTDDKMLTAILHDGKEIGRWYLASARAAPGLIAVAYAEPGTSLGYPKGIAVWHAKTGRWQSIDFAVGAIIGWGK